MSIRTFLLLVMIALLGLTACSDQEAPKGEVIAKINDYEMTRDEFYKRLAEEARYYDHMQMDRSIIEAYLEQSIRKELLIQEAVRRKLDREENFMRSIERFWENTLIRNVLEVQSEELKKKVFVSEEEIRSAYKEIKELDPNAAPLEELRERISQSLYDEKLTKAIDDWVDDLRAEADIVVDKTMLDASGKGEKQ